MKPVLSLFLLCICCLSLKAQHQTQFENRGFESWANYGSSDATIEPLGWHSTKSASGSFSGFLSQQIEPSIHTRPGSSGVKSVRLWPTSVVGVTANGNLTNGRMNAGSMSATGTGNYNYTQRSDERFNTPISTVPDSLTVWVCFRCADPSQNGQVRAVVHGDADFKFVSNGTVDPPDKLVASAQQSFKRTSQAGGDYNWRRLSIPFTNDGPCDDPRYILLTFTTNEVPGAGGTADDLFIDDVLLVYNPSIRMGAIDKDHFFFGESLTIPFTIEGTMSPENLNAMPNQLIVQLSSANGSFSNPTELGRMTTDSSDSITVTIPSDILSGEHYRIRLATTNYPMISLDNGVDIIISSGAAVTEQQEPMLQVAPNPACQFLHITSDQEISRVDFFNLTGKRVLSRQLISKDSVISLSGFASGIYLIHCQLPHHELYRKVVIQ